MVSGSASLSTTATATSSVAGGPYAITVDVSGLSAANYDFTGVDGALTITKAHLTVTAANASETGVWASFKIARSRREMVFRTPARIVPPIKSVGVSACPRER